MAKMKVVRPGATRRTVGVLATAEPSGQRCATYADRPPSGRGRPSPRPHRGEAGNPSLNHFPLETAANRSVERALHWVPSPQFAKSPCGAILFKATRVKLRPASYEPQPKTRLAPTRVIVRT